MIVLQTPEVAGYVEQRLGVKIHPPSTCLGFATDAGRPLMAAVFNGYNGANMDMSMVAEPGGITREALRYIAHYVFVTNGCRRLTIRTKKRNKTVLKLAPKAGFKFEAVASDYYPDSDAVVFRMLKSECEWLKNG